MHHLIHPLSLLLAILPVRAYEVAQCYWAKGQTLPQITGLPNSYIPCGEIEDGVQPCCRVGHNCLEAGACYAPDAGMVYTAGCTDRDYASSSCPSKCGISAFWVGHSYCNGTSNNWSCCENQYGNTRNQQFFPYNNRQQCWCPEENAMIGFNAPEKIPDVAYLDLEQPGSISYFPGHTPSAALGGSSTTDSPASTTSDTDSSTTFTTSTARTSESSSSSSSNTNTNSPASNTASPSNGSSASHSAAPDSTMSPSTSAPLDPSSDPGLPTGTKIGIGVGAGAGAVILASLLYLLLSFLRKRRKSPPPPIEDQIRPKSIGSSYAGMMSEAQNPQSPNSDAKSPAWSGHRSELPADEPAVAASPTIGSTTSSSMPSHPLVVAEVEATPPRQSVQSGSQMARGSGTSQPGYGADGIKRYIPYNPARGRSVQDIAELPG
ncbi:hypothetical protein EPUS_05463 [Endocarpon pusillum Z07020]|uniref:Mid2 domain-containing protein n=1 Tax=Endocarpon pusillum (strain Z07020 / HMAS-L-300199) TaxID=1263415 RepID=U1HLN4_ENDPU|nr:uncharacterized protein EPUS_05463 [Endocarpon pusillum Z07020]ERF69919.1 hypothetical protein EPUS_05463 [Endocarpon pusillum Z07020]